MCSKGLSVLIVLICIGFSALGQGTDEDSVEFIQPKSYFSSEQHVSFRVGFGVQKSFYTEIGIALQKCNFSDVGFFSNDFYSALEWTPRKNEGIYGLKIGYEANSYLLNLGLEAKYLTDFKESDFVITPKIGMGIVGVINVFYGYNFSLNKNPFSDRIGHHQFSIVFNVNRRFLSWY